VIFRQLFDPQSCTYTYLLADEGTREAILIDPVHGQAERDEQLLRELGLTLKVIAETHVHADHVTGAGVLKTRLGGALAVSRHAQVPAAEVRLADGDVLQVGAVRLVVRETPGHTDCSVSYVSADGKLAFTGDALLIRGCGRTDFQQGDARTLFRSVREKLFTLDDDALIYPGHDYKGRTVSTVGEEKAHNPRLTMSRSVDEFVEIMENLGLPYPKLIDQAVPANVRSGYALLPAVDAEAWAVLARTPAGVPEVSAAWVSAHAHTVRLVDVREPEELTGPLGCIAGVQGVPLAGLEAEAQAWSHDKPVVLVCRSGGRSGSGALALERVGFQRVASMAGGMLRWNALGLSRVS
jgi:sulfur dioxygenase